MTVYSIWVGLIDGWNNMSWPEVLAVVFSIISVLYAKRNSLWVYPTGIIGILFSIWIFVQAENKLYPDAVLNLYYLIMSIYGWYIWKHGGADRHEKPLSWCSRKEYLWAFMLFVSLWVGLYYWLSTYHVNNVPLTDAFSSAMAAVGMWLLAKRKIENWIALLLADAVDVVVFFIKKLILFCGLNLFYVIIAWVGFLAWKKFYANQLEKNMTVLQNAP